MEGHSRFLIVLVGSSVVEPSCGVNLWMKKSQAEMTVSSVLCEGKLTMVLLASSLICQTGKEVMRAKTDGSSGKKDKVCQKLSVKKQVRPLISLLPEILCGPASPHLYADHQQISKLS